MNTIHSLLVSFSIHTALDGIEISHYYIIVWGHAVVQLVEALRYKPVGHRFDSRWCNSNFSLT